MKMRNDRFPSIFKANSEPKFPFDEDFQEDEPEFDDKCPNCNNPLSDHTDRQRIRCALDRIGGIPPYVDTKTT